MNVQVWAIVGKEPQVEYDHQYPLRIFEVQKFRFFLDESMNDSVSMMPRDTIFHLHSVFVPELYALSRRLKKQKLKWVIAPHGGYAPGSLRKNSIAKLAYMAFFEKRLIHQASAMHAIGLYGEADQFNNQAYKSKIGLVPNGQNLPKRFKQWSQSPGQLALVFCGRLARAQKGLDLLLSGLQIAVVNGVDARLELIGDGPDRAALEFMVRELNLIDRVVFHGAQVKTEKEDLLMRADLFVHTTRWDVVPTAVLEAAGHALPVLISPQTNLADYIEAAGAGYVTRGLTAEAIAVQIGQAASDKVSGNLWQKGLAARSMIEQKFSWAEIAELLDESVYSIAAPE
jgi:glycosyltransferase involved in cell wall biosynthesis